MSYPQRTLKDGLLYLDGRSDEDDGYRTGNKSVQSVIDTTTDPAKHFVARRMQNDVLNPNRHKNFIIERHAGIRYCWIGLRTSAYTSLVRSRIPLWDSGLLSPESNVLHVGLNADCVSSQDGVQPDDAQC